MISVKMRSALSKAAAAFFAAVLLSSGRFLLECKAYDYGSVSGAYATGASISGYKSALAVNVADLGADPTGKKDSRKAIQKALDYAGEHADDDVQVKVIIPSGTYSISGCLYIHSNTWLYMEGATLRRDYKKGCMIMNYMDNDDGGFDASRNIVIEGGCLDGNTNDDVYTFSHIRMGHLHDLWIRNVDFKDNYNCHHLELGGIRNVTIEGCKFHEFRGAKHKEAIQFDMLNNENLFEGFEPFDDTSCDNVIIRNNNFYDTMRGIGSHSATVGQYYTNFSITDNTFNNIYDVAIIMENYRCCTIENNILTNVGSGITFKNMTSLESSGYNVPVDGFDGIYDRINDFSDMVIRGNTISTFITSECPKPYGISLYGRLVQDGLFPDHDYKVEGVLIEQNNITTAGIGITMNDTTGVLVSSNTIGCPSDTETYDSNLVNVKYSQGVSVKNNNLMGSQGDSVSVLGGTDGLVADNICMNSSGSGIRAENNAALTIKGNKLTNSFENGITVSDGAKAEIENNTIEGSEDCGVMLTGVSGINVKSNTFTGCKTACINAAEDADAYVSDNKFSDSGSNYMGNVYARPVSQIIADGVYGDHIQLSWTSEGNSDGYSVKRRSLSSGGEFKEVAVVGTASFSDDGLPSNTRYEYRVDAILKTDNGVTESVSQPMAVRTKASLSGCTSDIIPVYKYSGRYIEPDFKVYLDGCELIKDIDYKVKFYNNFAAGKAAAVVSGCGQFYGFKEFNFDISLTDGATVTEQRNEQIAIASPLKENYAVAASSSMTENSSSSAAENVTATPAADSSMIVEENSIVEAADKLAESYVPEGEETSSQAQTEQLTVQQRTDEVMVMNNAHDPSVFVQRWAAF